MRRVLSLLVLGLVALSGCVAQGQGQDSSQPFVLSTQTSVVTVPALVRTRAGELVFGLKPEDFVLTDNGVAQKITIEPETGGEPLALVVVVEIGGAGAREFDHLGS